MSIYFSSVSQCLHEFDNDWIKLVLDKLSDESGVDNSLCEKIILRPDCNLLEMCQYDGFTDIIALACLPIL